MVQAGERLQLLDRPDGMVVSFRALPDRQGGAPVPLPGEVPVLDLFEEVTEPSILYVVGIPRYPLVVPLEVLPQLGHAYEEPLPGIVQEWSVASPAERILVGVEMYALKEPPLLEVLDYEGIRGFDEHAHPWCHGIREGPVSLDRLHHWQSIGGPKVVIVLPEGGCYVNDAGPILHRDEIRRAHEVCRPVGLYEGIQRLVPGPLQIRSHEPPDDRILALLQKDPRPLLGEYQLRSLVLDDEVELVRMDRQGDVGYQRPRCCGPCQYVSVILPYDLELDEDRRVLHLPVSLGDLVGGERGPASGAVGDDGMPLAQKPLLPDLLERPPDRFYILIGHGYVRAVQIENVTEALRHSGPVVYV